MTGALLMLWLVADLRVEAARRDRVELRWDALPDEEAIVWRRSGEGEYRRLGIGRLGYFVDRDFDPHSRYVYRVEREERGMTNEVTVGAPPRGLQAAWPEVRPAELRMALDAAGDPHVAWLERVDGEAILWYGRWDRAGARWSEPRELARVGQVERAPRYPLAIAADPDTGAVGVAFEENRNGTRLMLAVAARGTGFQTREILNGGGRWFADVRLALARGEAFLAYQQQDSGTHFTHGPLGRDPRFWLTQAAPVLGGFRDPGHALDLALDAQGRPALVYLLRGETESVAVFWRPKENPEPVGRPGATPRASIRLAFQGTRPVVVTDTDFQSERGADVWLVTANERQEWSEGARVAPGPHATLNAPLGLDVSAKGEVALAAEAPDGFLHVARSPDGREWPRKAMRKFEGRSPELALGEDGGLRLTFAARGVWFWRESPER